MVDNWLKQMGRPDLCGQHAEPPQLIVDDVLRQHPHLSSEDARARAEARYLCLLNPHPQRTSSVAPVKAESGPADLRPYLVAIIALLVFLLVVSVLRAHGQDAEVVEGVIQCPSLTVQP